MTCANSECPFSVTKKENGESANLHSQCLVAVSVKQVRFSKREILFSQNEPTCCVYALTSGIVKLCDVSPSGDQPS